MHNIDLAHFAAHARQSTMTNPLDDPALELAREGRLSVHWAPFDHVAPAARLVLVGITPGRDQAGNAYAAFRSALQHHPLEEALRIAKRTGSFSGPLRGNLVRMLDAVGVQKPFQLRTCAALFDGPSEQVHMTSALRYPVLYAGANYNGTPDMLRTPLLRRMVETYLADELRSLPRALVLPLGPKPTAALRHLVSLGVLSKDRVLEGLPHPSGANGERISYFLGLKPKAVLSVKTRPEMIDKARGVLLAQVASMMKA